MSVPGRRATVRLFGAAGYAAVSFASAPAWPDDWDGIGFVESIGDFDLARFHPHPPGYPVYVALLRVAAAVVRDPLRAATLTSVLSGVLAVALIWDGARRVAGERAAWTVSALVAVAPLAWRACSGVGSEAPALACAAGCVWGLSAASSASRTANARDVRAGVAGVAVGLACGLGLGVRLSWAPVYLAALALAGPARRTAIGVAAASSIAWGVPLLVLVGPRRLGALLGEHLAGHALRWGGTAVTAPGGARIAWLARDVIVDGLGAGSDALGLAIAALAAAVAVQATAEWGAAGWRGWRRAAWLLAPYALWIGLGQNLRDQPRHTLPLVVALAAALGFASARRRGPTALLGIALTAAVGTRAAMDAHARRTIPPPGVQLVALARADPRPQRLVLFGTASVRFFEMTAAADGPRALVAGSLGDVQLALTRLPELPARVWITSEIEGLGDSRWPLSSVAALCRPPRIERRLPCLSVYEWSPPYLPMQ